jgi:glyoxalase family protein
MRQISGLHHVTSIGSSAELTVNFYTKVLGLRTVKRTVNFDKVEELHFYCGSFASGHAALIAFFIREGAAPGRSGTGQVAAITFSIPRHSMRLWRNRLLSNGVPVVGFARAFGEMHLCFTDPDGLHLSFVEQTTGFDSQPYPFRSAEEPYAIVDIRSVEVHIEGYEHIARLFVDVFGFEANGRDGSVFRFQDRSATSTVAIDLLCAPDCEPGIPGPGVAHHVAWRVADERVLLRLRAMLADKGYDITPPLDRHYYQAAYFQAPGGLHFALATEGPGFLIDEPVETLGSTLRLPPWLELAGGKVIHRSPKRRR